ncbi:MAG: hypothetical protein JWN39_1392, partial [Ilumatobacteraceae bacterium]|nr:hypothetical protein [Ilumatobacteraceae bacterium]
MTRVDAGLHLPRATGSSTWRPLLPLVGQSPEFFIDNPIDIRRAEFHSGGEQRISESQLLAWRRDLNDWAYDRGFPAPLNTERRSAWDVELGVRLLEDTQELPEAFHPDVWCWLATHLLPHFIVYRWGWPSSTNGEP